MVDRTSLCSQKTGYSFRPRSCKAPVEKKSATRRASTTVKRQATNTGTVSPRPSRRDSPMRDDTPESTSSFFASTSASSRESTPDTPVVAPVRRSRVPTGRRSTRKAAPAAEYGQPRPCTVFGCSGVMRKRHLATHQEWLEEQWGLGGIDAYFATLNARASLVCDDPSHPHRSKSNISHFWIHIDKHGCSPVHPIVAHNNAIRLASRRAGEAAVLRDLARCQVSVEAFRPHWRVSGEEYLPGGSRHGSAAELLATLGSSPRDGYTGNASYSPSTTASNSSAYSSASDWPEEDWSREEVHHTRSDLRPSTPFGSLSAEPHPHSDASLVHSTHFHPNVLPMQPTMVPSFTYDYWRPDAPPRLNNYVHAGGYPGVHAWRPEIVAYPTMDSHHLAGYGWVVPGPYAVGGLGYGAEPFNAGMANIDPRLAHMAY